MWFRCAALVIVYDIYMTSLMKIAQYKKPYSIWERVYATYIVTRSVNGKHQFGLFDHMVFIRPDTQ